MSLDKIKINLDNYSRAEDLTNLYEFWKSMIVFCVICKDAEGVNSARDMLLRIQSKKDSLKLK